MRTAYVMLLTIAAASAEPRLSWDFEGGILQRVEKAGDRHWRAFLEGETDQDKRNRQASWYAFRVDGAGKDPLTIDVVNLPGEYNYKPNQGAVTADTPPVISYDGKTWEHVSDFEFDKAEPRMRLRISPKKDLFWIAHVPPYTNKNLNELRSWARGKQGFREEQLIRTPDGRPMWLWTIGNGPKTVWLMFRQHSWEAGSSWVGEGLVRHLLSKEGAELRKSVTWKILPMCDPDGVARGGVRFNKFGYDLNRNWDVNGVEKMPEITAQRAAIKKWLDGGGKVDLFFSLHNTETGEYLEGPPHKGGEGKYVALAERLFRELETKTSFAPTRPLFFAELSTTAGRPGRMNVIQGLYRDFQIPGFLMEQRISKQPKYGRRPLPEDRIRFGRELAEAIANSLGS